MDNAPNPRRYMKVFQEGLSLHVHYLKLVKFVFMMNGTCTYFTLELCFMDIKMKNFYLDPFQRLTAGAFTRYVTFHKR